MRDGDSLGGKNTLQLRFMTHVIQLVLPEFLGRGGHLCEVDEGPDAVEHRGDDETPEGDERKTRGRQGGDQGLKMCAMRVIGVMGVMRVMGEEDGV